MKFRTVWREFEIEVLGACPRHIRLTCRCTCASFFSLRSASGSTFSAPFGTQMKAQKPALLVNPGCKVSESGLDRRPVPLFFFMLVPVARPKMTGRKAAMWGEILHQMFDVFGALAAQRVCARAEGRWRARCRPPAPHRQSRRAAWCNVPSICRCRGWTSVSSRLPRRSLR